MGAEHAGVRDQLRGSVIRKVPADQRVAPNLPADDAARAAFDGRQAG